MRAFCYNPNRGELTKTDDFFSFLYVSVQTTCEKTYRASRFLYASPGKGMNAVLSAKKIEALKPQEKRYVVRVEDHLYVEVRPNGAKSWLFRNMKNGVQVKKTLGIVGEVDLYTARAKRDELLADRGNPTNEGEENRILFRDLADDWMTRILIPRVTIRRANQQESRLRRYILPMIGEMYADEVRPRDILQIIRGIEAAGYIDLAHDIAGLISMILRYGVSMGYVERDCVADLRGAFKPTIVKHRATITKHNEIAGLMQSIDTLNEGPVKWGLYLCAYTFLRPSEVRKGVWDEIDFERREWKIPAERMKMRRPHIVPLADQSIAILRKALGYSRGRTYILPTLRGTGRPLSNMAFMTGLRRIGYGQGTMTVHGFRSMASTILNEYGWSPDAIERQLAHVHNDVREVYNYAQYLDERRRMVQWYADFLDALRDSHPVPEKA